MKEISTEKALKALVRGTSVEYRTTKGEMGTIEPDTCFSNFPFNCKYYIKETVKVALFTLTCDADGRLYSFTEADLKNPDIDNNYGRVSDWVEIKVWK